MYNIQPFNITFGSTTKVATMVNLGYNYKAFQTTLPFDVTYYSADYQILGAENKTLDEAVVALWGTDDTYIIDAMASAVGVTIIW